MSKKRTRQSLSKEVKQDSFLATNHGHSFKAAAEAAGVVIGSKSLHYSRASWKRRFENPSKLL